MNAKTVKRFISNNTIVPILLIVFIVSAIFVPGFFSVANISNVFNQNAMKGVMAIGMTFLILNGTFDMSMCTTVGLTAALVCGLSRNMPLPAAVLLALLAGAVIGVINGMLVSYVGINAFVVTLAMMMGVHGIAYCYHKGNSILSVSEIFNEFGSGKLGIISYSSILYILALIIAHYVLTYTEFGRKVYATGGNANAAFNAGIDTKKITCINFIICGVAAAAGGIMYAAAQGASTPGLGWPDMHMLVIAGVVLGGTKLSGGVGNVWYSMGGVMLLGIIDNIMNLLNVQTYMSTLVNGVIMIAVLCLDKIMMNKQMKKTNLAE